MSQGDTFQAKIVASLSTPGGSESVKILQELDYAANQFTGHAKESAKAIANMVKEIKAGKGDMDQLRTLMKGMGDDFKVLSNTQKTKGLFFTNADIESILSVAKAIRQASEAFKAMETSKGLSKGNFGMDSKTVKDTADNLKILQTNLNAINMVLSTTPKNQSMLLQKTMIEENIKNLGLFRQAMITTSELDKKIKSEAEADLRKRKADVAKGISTFVSTTSGAFEKGELDAAQKRNREANAKQDDLDAQRIRLKRADSRAYYAQLLKDEEADKLKKKQLRESFDNGELEAARKRNKLELDTERAARKAKLDELRKDMLERSRLAEKLATPRGQVGVFRQEAQQAPGYVPSSIGGVGRRENTRYLKDAFAQANTAYRPSTSQYTDQEKIRGTLQKILDLENQIVESRRKGNVNLEEEKKKISEIGQLQIQVATQRRTDSAALDRSRQAQHMLDRITGESGGALFAVQSVLNVNQAIISGIRNALSSAVSYAINLEAAFKNVQAVTATTKTEMVGLEDAIKHVAGSTKFNAQEVADAALILGQAGLSASEVATSIKPVVELATASGSSLQQAVEIVTSVVGVFNVTTSETADVANKITQAVNVSKLSIEKLGLGLQYAGNTASQLGLSFEEVTASLAAMSQAGIKSGSTMGTGLRQILVEIQKPSKEFLSTLTSVGLTLSDLDLRTQSWSEVLRKLRDAGFVASDAIQSFDVRGAAAFNALIANPEYLDKTIAGLNGTAAATKANEIQMQSLQNQGLRLGSALGNLVSTGLEPTSKALATLVGGLASVIQAMSESKVAVGVLGTVIAGALGAGIASSLAMTLRSLIAVAPALMRMGEAVPVLGALGATMARVGVAATFLGKVLSPSGIGLAITAVTGLYFLFSGAMNTSAEKTEELTAALDKSQGKLKEKSETIDSLSKKILELQQKQNFYKENTAALTNEISSLNQKFGQWGMDLTKVGGNIDGLIQKLINLRGEITNLQLEEFRGVEQKAQALATQKAKEAQEAAAGFTPNSTWNRLTMSGGVNLEPMLQGPYKGQLANLLKAEGGAQSESFKTLQTLYSTSASAKKPEDIQGADVAAKVLERLLALAKEKDSATSGGTYKPLVALLTKASEDTAKLATALGESRQARGVADEASLGTRKAEALKTFKAQSGYEARMAIPDLAETAKAKGATTAIGQYESAVAQVEVINKQLKDFSEEISKKFGFKVGDKDSVKASVKAAFDQAVEDRVSMARSQLAKLKEGAGPELVARDAAQDRDYAAQSANLKARQKKGQDTLEAQKALDRMHNEQLTSRKLRDVLGTSPEAATIRAEGKATLDTTLDTLEVRAGESAKAATERALKNQIDTLELEIQNKLKEAKQTKGSVTGAMGFEKISEALNDGEKLIGEARALTMKQLALKMRAGTATDADRKPLNEKLDNDITALQDSFSGLYGEAAKRLYDVTASIKASKNKLAGLKVQGEAQAFTSGAAVRDIETTIASGGGTPYTSSELNQAKVTQAEQSLVIIKASAIETENIITQASAKLEQLKAENLETEAKFQAINIKAPNDQTKEDRRNLIPLEKARAEQVASINESEAEINAAVKERTDLLMREYETRSRIVSLKPRTGSEMTPGGMKEQGMGALKKYGEDVQAIDANQLFGQGIYDELGKVQGKFSTFFSDITVGAKSSKEAFKDLTTGILKGLAELMAQQAAIMLVKSLFNIGMAAFGGDSSGGDTSAGGGFNGSAGDAGAGMSNVARHGGLINDYGKVQHFAAGGHVSGGSASGRDSVRAMLMPGEFVLTKTATDAVGADFLHNLNAQGNTVADQNSPSAMRNENKGAGSTVNVWVVSPDQKPVPGPKDIVAIITDDISRGGSVKQLIKSVQAGAV